MSILRRHICWRCGHEEDVEGYNVPEFCPECGEPTIVSVEELIDAVNELYLSGIIDERLRLSSGIVL